MTLSRRSVEVGLLVALCFFLPLFEAPKNILWVAYLIVWGVNRVRARDFGGRWDWWDTLIAAWIASGYVVAAFAGLDGDQWRGAADLFRYGSVLWVVKRSRFTAREIRWIFGALVVSTVIGLALGHARLLSGELHDLQLNSVGHVNHTAIYLAIMLGVCASWLFTGWRAWRPAQRTAAACIALLVLVSVIFTASRGAVGVAFVMLLVLAAVWWRRSRAALPVTAAVVALFAVAIFLGGAEVLRKQQANAEANNVLSYRDAIWRTALAAWQRYPWAGVGIDNYARITHDRLKAWRAEAGKDYDPRLYFPYGHAHSLYLNTLAERGLVGATALMAVLAAWLIFLLRYRPPPQAPDDDWLLWGSAAGAWMVTTAAGLVNTTLHHEHGILAALLLGLWLSRVRESRAPDKR
jgi:O-antigen ligase